MSQRSLADFLRTTKQQVDKELAKTLEKAIQPAVHIDASYEDLCQQVSTLVVRGGKRLRSALLLLAYQGYGGKDEQSVLPVAVMQELFHVFLLVHDDIIDRDHIRYNALNISGYYFSLFSERLSLPDAQHFAESWALLAGDFCLNASYGVLLNSSLAEDKKLRVLQVMQQTLFETIGGELLDANLPLSKANPSQKQLLAVARYKTAAYSFGAPLKLGALLADANKEQAKLLERCANHLGIAFQLQDDLLGIFGDSQLLGKSNLSDIREGKRTLLMSYGLRLADKTGRGLLQAQLSNVNATTADLMRVRTVLEICGARAKTERLAGEHLVRAKRIIASLALEPVNRDLLLDLADFTVQRNY